MASDSIPHKPRSSLHTCCPSHGLKRSGHSCPRRVNACNKKHTQHAPSTKTERDYLNGWIKKNGHMRKHLTQNGEPKRYSWERRRRRRRSAAFVSVWQHAKLST